jgi:hypothetical protein
MNVEQARRDVEQARRAYVLEPNSYTYWALVESLKRAAIKEAESQRPARRIRLAAWKEAMSTAEQQFLQMADTPNGRIRGIRDIAERHEARSSAS